MSYPGGPPQGQPWPSPQPQFGPPPGGPPSMPGGYPAPQGQPMPPGPGPVPPPPGPPGAPPMPYGQQPPGQPPMAPGQPPAPYGQQPPPPGMMPPGMPGPAAGQPLPGDPPGLTVDASFFPMAFLLYLVKPKIIVDGQRVPVTRWGPNHIPVGPGQHHVQVSTPFLFDMGPANTVVPIEPGQAARVYYRSPAVIFLNGAIGPVPQKTPGMIFLYLSWGATAALVLLNFLLLATGP